MTSRAGAAETAPTRGPWSYLAWLVVQQPRRVALGAVLGTVWMVGLVVPPFLLSRAVDALDGADRSAVAGWALALTVTGAALGALGIWRHRTMTQVRMDAAHRTVATVTAHAVRLGASLDRRSRAGEIVAIGSGDAWTIGRSLTVTGPGVGALLAYAVITVLLLQVSWPLAVVVLGGVPVLALVLGPALSRLRTVGGAYRDHQAVVTGRIVDIIAGLAVLNGLGGKAAYADRFRRESQELLRQGYRVGRVTALIQALGLGLPPLFMAVVVWLAARLVAQGSITIADLVAVFGYAAVLVVPVSTVIEGAVDINHALVAGRRVTEFLSLRRQDDRRGGTSEQLSADVGPSGGGDLVDQVSGVSVPAGTFAAVVTARQADAAAVIDRLGGFAGGGTWGGRPLGDFPAAQLRRQLLVADNDAALFAGSLAAVVAGRHDVAASDVVRALHTAAADELVDGLPGGVWSPIEGNGANLSGGQRQRVRLARALLAEPEVLLAVDPTSAVDAATEATIVRRLVEARAGRTTVVSSTSPLLLAEADRVHLLAGDQMLAVGTHASLLSDVPAYAALVFRGDPPTPPDSDGSAGDGGGA